MPRQDFRKPLVLCCLFLVVTATRIRATSAEENTIPLAGTWRFKLEAENAGVDEAWFAHELDDTVTLPPFSHPKEL